MINRIFKITGILCLAIICFIYTEKSAQVIRQKDPIMIQIEENKEILKQEAIDAKINNDTIVPGYYGYEVNVNESYENMKKYGIYNEAMIKYRLIRPNISIEDVYDKYIISGNKNKNAISLVFVVKTNDDISKIIEVLDKTKTKATFFMDIYYIEKNTEIINKLKSLGCEIEHLNYLEEELVLTNKELSKLNIVPKYCYTNMNNSKIIDTCKQYSMHTIKPITLSNIAAKTKTIIDSGVLLDLKINKEINQSLEYIISFIKQKGYKIMTLDEHLNEKRLEKKQY